MPCTPPIVLPTIESLLAVKAVAESVSVNGLTVGSDSAKIDTVRRASLALFTPVAAQKKTEFEFRALQRRSEHERKRLLSRYNAHARSTPLATTAGVKMKKHPSGQQIQNIDDDDAMYQITRMQLFHGHRHHHEKSNHSHAAPPRNSEEWLQSLNQFSINTAAASHRNDLGATESTSLRERREILAQVLLETAQRQKWKRAFLQSLLPDAANTGGDLVDVLTVVPRFVESSFDVPKSSPSMELWVPCNEPGCSVEASLWSTEEHAAFCVVHWGQKPFHLDTGIKYNRAVHREADSRPSSLTLGGGEPRKKVSADLLPRGDLDSGGEGNQHRLATAGAFRRVRSAAIPSSPVTSAGLGSGRRFFASVAPFDAISRAARSTKDALGAWRFEAAGGAPPTAYYSVAAAARSTVYPSPPRAGGSVATERRVARSGAHGSRRNSRQQLTGLAHSITPLRWPTAEDDTPATQPAVEIFRGQAVYVKRPLPGRCCPSST
jgi:hypothetical protein